MKIAIAIFFIILALSGILGKYLPDSKKRKAIKAHVKNREFLKETTRNFLKGQ